MVSGNIPCLFYQDHYPDVCLPAVSNPCPLSLSGENKNTMKFSDGKVCKSFLIGCCPHDILASTVSAVHGRPPLYLVVITIHKHILRLNYSPDVGHIELLLCPLLRSSSGCYQYRTAINSGHPLLYWLCISEHYSCVDSVSDLMKKIDL